VAAPIPPAPLRGRVSLRDDAEIYDRIGATTREKLLAALPSEFSWDGARVLDFGCGAGRALRHLDDEARRCDEFLACDIDRASIDWVKANLDPPFHAFVNELEPPLPLESASLDLVYAISVFTHLSDSWARWLAELHRVLKPGGLLFATFLGSGVWPNGFGAGMGVEHEEIGMQVEQPWGAFRGFHGHGPAVFHSSWWLREHWGRAFELLDLYERGFVVIANVHEGQGAALWRRRDVEIDPEQLERRGEDPRELRALELSAAIARQESAHQVSDHRERLAALDAELATVRAELEAVRASKIMRLSEPARRAWYRLRER
jgi:SAM-dependent methyltransferase